MKAVILAGGEGTRLRPITCTIPKPLVPVCGKPVLEHILDLLALHGCGEAIIAVRYQGDKIERHFRPMSYKGIKLSFSHENKPLGTAGCVKKSAEGIKEDFIVISGDAMCDFDISEALRRHKESGADATIITKRVDDPREYGLIIEEDNRITDFSEKPSYINCRSELANTGVYILSPKVCELIPEDEMWDFAKNVFPDMLSRNMFILNFEEKGYWCDIGDIQAYKRCCSDMLNGKIKADFPDGKHLSSSASSGSFIGRDSSIDESSVISGNTVIGQSVSVGKGAKLRNAIIMDGVYIGENTTINDCVICRNARIESGAAVYENAVVGENSVIGENAAICGNIRVWPDKTVGKGDFVNSDRKYGVKSNIEITEDGICGETNTVITTEFAGRLGCAIAKITENYAAVSCSDENAAETLKSALLSGISSTGKQCFDCGNATLPILSHTSRLLNCDIIVHISARTRTRILIYNKGLLPLTRAQERMLENAFIRGEYLSASWNNFSSINRFTGSLSLYKAKLDKLTDFEIPYRIELTCLNSFSNSLYMPYLRKIGTGKAPLTLTLNEKNTKAEISDENGTRIDSCSMVLLSAAEAMKAGKDAALPFSFPIAADHTADKLERKIHRFYASSMDNSDRYARELASEQDFLYDGFIQALCVFRLMNEQLLTPSEVLDTLPKFNEINKFIHISCPPQKILSRIAGGKTAENEGVVISGDSERIFMRSNKKGTGLYLFAESFSSETAAILCEKAENMIKSVMNRELSEHGEA